MSHVQPIAGMTIVRPARRPQPGEVIVSYEIIHPQVRDAGRGLGRGAVAAGLSTFRWRCGAVWGNGGAQGGRRGC